ncbi:transposase [candidate division KSB1 bacterium]|nr:transposase [candidate division KSB1 bacterium]
MSSNDFLYITDQFQLNEYSSEHALHIRKRNLPHWEMEAAVYFVTFRLSDTIPVAIIKQLREANEQSIALELARTGKTNHNRVHELKFNLLMQIDDYLDNNQEIRYLSNPEIARIIQNALLFFGVLFVHDIEPIADMPTIKIIHSESTESLLPKPRYILLRWMIMPNHVHVLLQPLVDTETGVCYTLEKIFHSIKSYTAQEANKILNRNGQFWHHESYDHIVRDENSFDRIWRYIDNNAVKAGLCSDVLDFQWSSACLIKKLKLEA